MYATYQTDNKREKGEEAREREKCIELNSSIASTTCTCMHTLYVLCTNKPPPVTGSFCNGLG